MSGAARVAVLMRDQIRDSRYHTIIAVQGANFKRGDGIARATDRQRIDIQS
jgi:hypothetical protein